jgi:Pregnancy-associated plasma protein-A/Secretion system C-terminal sorting domain
MQHFLCTLLAAVILTAANAQQPATSPVICGNDIFHHWVESQYPDLHESFEKTMEAVRAQRVGAEDRNELVINVVVHVVWKETAENLSDALIQEQIAVLNEDYNRENADTANLRTVFKPVAGNAGIRFRLAEIRRVKTTKDFTVSLTDTNLLGDLKRTDKGGSSGADPQRFLNIWICHVKPLSILGLQLGQILGFAFPPNGLANWPANSSAPSPEDDGVVLDFRTVGRNNPNPVDLGQGKLVVRGRTGVHEVGHYLGLRHIWGDGGLFGLPNNCNSSDGVDDTPHANAQSPFDCNKERNTCTRTEDFYKNDVPDLVENYMDYSAETCMNMFTKGQVAIMRGVLQGPRKNLVSGSVTTTDLAAAPHWQVSPNPATDRVAVTFDLTKATEVTLALTALDGRCVARQATQLLPVGAQQIALDVQALPAGIYCISLQTENGVTAKKVQIQ